MNKFQTGLAFCLLLASSLVCAGEWVEDPISGCAIWNDEPSKGGDVVSWSGECENDKATGHGVLSWFADGGLLVRYIGALKAGKVDGVGSMIIREEQGKGYDHYEAEFIDGEFEGEVVLNSANGDRFQGSMKQSIIEGYGSYIGANGDRYDGDFVNGLPQGAGFSEAADGEVYKGLFQAGNRHGEGTLIDANGDEFEGEFVDGKMQGWGSWRSTDGSRFEGQFRDGKPNGQGIYRAPNGDIFNGSFVDGMADGEISVTTAEGQQSTQVWKNGEQA